ncbi:hypothetical protein MD484_g5618, partial [Candolleomyces efflorescens]
MNAQYDVNAAKRILEEKLAGVNMPDAVHVLHIRDMKVEDFIVKTIAHPPSIRMMVQEDEEEYEAVMKIYGVICGGVLPPFQRQPRSLTPSKMRNLRQHVKITTFGVEDGTAQQIAKLRELIQDHTGADVQEMEFLPYEGHPCFEAHARYFTDRNLIPYEKSTPFPSNVDPHHILSNLRPDLFVRGPDNCVEYCKETVDARGNIKYLPVNPAIFNPGDVIEVAFSCVGVPVKEGRYRLLLNLRAVTLVTDECRKKSEVESLSKNRAAQGEPGFVLKRKRLYVDEDEPARNSKAGKRTRTSVVGETQDCMEMDYN